MRATDLVQPDVTLLLDMGGTIREATLANGVAAEDMAAWLGRSWLDTVKDRGSGKVERLLADTATNGLCAFRQMTQCFPSGLELPMEYTAVLLGGRAGILAIGKSLRAVAELQSRLVAAQQEIERDFWKLRQVETRYRLLFKTSSEAVLLLSAPGLRIVEANPAAAAALGLDENRSEIAGRQFLSFVDPQERIALQAMLQRAEEGGKAPGVVVQIGKSGTKWAVRASLMPVDAKAAYLLQLSPVPTVPIVSEPSEKNSVAELLDQLPDGFAIVDEGGRVRSANRMFLDLIESATSGAVGLPLQRWLTRPGADAAVLVDAVFRHGSVRLFNTWIHSELGTDTEVEISAAAHEGPRGLFAGIVIRPVAPRLSSRADGNHFAALLTSLVGQVGRTPLRKLVRDTVGEVEREYVKAALDLANGKRTAAAEILGLSRQSLYSKLSRYGLHESSSFPPDSDE